MQLEQAVCLIALHGVIAFAPLDGPVREQVELLEHTRLSCGSDAVLHEARIWTVANRPVAVAVAFHRRFKSSTPRSSGFGVLPGCTVRPARTAPPACPS